MSKSNKTSSTQTAHRQTHRKHGVSLNVASIVQRLPFHHQLSASQHLILKLTPVWYDWCEQQRSNKGSKQFSAFNDTELSSFDNGVLVLACRNQNTATRLKHQRTSLLEKLHAAGFDELSEIRIRMALTTHSNQSTATHSSHETPSFQRQTLTVNREKPSSRSIQSVESVQRRINHEPLAASLKRLADTLKRQ